MTSDAIVTLLVAVFGGGTVAAIVQGIVSHRKGVRDADVARDQTAIAGFRDLAEELRKEVDRLKAARAEDSERIDRIERQIAVERDAKWSAIQYIRQLHSWIVAHIPSTAGPVPPVPDDLTQHIHIPRKDQP